MEDARGEVLHVDLECLPVAHAWDPWHFMNGGKWVTTADIRDLGHSKREKKGCLTDSSRVMTKLCMWSCPAAGGYERRENLQCKLFANHHLIWWIEYEKKGSPEPDFSYFAYLWFPLAVHISALQCAISGDHLTYHKNLIHITQSFCVCLRLSFKCLDRKMKYKSHTAPNELQKYKKSWWLDATRDVTSQRKEETQRLKIQNFKSYI